MAAIRARASPNGHGLVIPVVLVMPIDVSTFVDCHGQMMRCGIAVAISTLGVDLRHGIISVKVERCRVGLWSAITVVVRSKFTAIGVENLDVIFPFGVFGLLLLQR